MLKNGGMVLRFGLLKGNMRINPLDFGVTVFFPSDTAKQKFQIAKALPGSLRKGLLSNLGRGSSNVPVSRSGLTGWVNPD